MRVFIACLGTETNTFSPMPTGWQTFEETLLRHGDGSRIPETLFTAAMQEWRSRTEAGGGTVVESISAFAQPAGVTVRSVYESLRDELLADLRAALPVDMVLLSMHGAMVADGYDDCEGDILARVRAIAGPETVIGAELDLHCSITPDITENADAVVTFKEYPHIDARERAGELFEICRARLEGRATPVMAVFDTRMIGMWRTPVEPMRAFVARMRDLEGRDGILSVSLAHGFPWGDVPEVTAKVLVVADGDRSKAAATAEQLGREFFEQRHALETRMHSIDEALDQALGHASGPVVLADVSDNAGGGAPADATFFLRRILERGIGNVASGLYWDPLAVRFCKEAGEGATFDLRFGGRCGPASGDPLDARVTVRRIVEKAHQSFGTGRAELGTAVWVSLAKDIDIVLTEVRCQTFNPDAFSVVGIDLAARHIVVVKSTQHFYAGFAPIAREVLYVATPGAIQPDFAAIPYAKFTRPYWPRDENPFS